MIQSAVDTLFNASSPLQKQILALLAIAGEPVGKEGDIRAVRRIAGPDHLAMFVHAAEDRKSVV